MTKTKKMSSKNETIQGSIMNALHNFAGYANNQVATLNQSKIFAGLMIVTINVASKFVSFKMSKTVESYLKYTFSRDILVFAITWMGTRDIYVAIGLTLLFVIIVDYLFNEQSSFCCLPEAFTDYHVSKLEGMENQMPTIDEIAKAKLVLEKAKLNANGMNGMNVNGMNANGMNANGMNANGMNTNTMNM